MHVFASMEVRIRRGTGIESYASYEVSWNDTPLFDPSKGNRPTSIGNSGP